MPACQGPVPSFKQHRFFPPNPPGNLLGRSDWGSWPHEGLTEVPFPFFATMVVTGSKSKSLCLMPSVVAPCPRSTLSSKWHPIFGVQLHRTKDRGHRGSGYLHSIG